MAKELTYRLSDPGYTIYHRAALGGLAATMRAWRNRGAPAGIEFSFDEKSARLAWSGDNDKEALQRILEAAFRIREDLAVIELPGQTPEGSGDDLLVALHNGYTGTFLQHNKMRPPPPGEKTRTITLRNPDDGKEFVVKYRPVANYAHRKAQGTELMESAKISLPSTAAVSQSVVPGALRGARSLSVRSEEAILLLFLMVGSIAFTLRSKRHESKSQYCLVIPDPVDLEAFSYALHHLATESAQKRFSSSFLGRIAGGAEEAALKFMIDLESESIGGSSAVRSCLAVTMGKVAWDANQVNRSAIVQLGKDYPEIEIFLAAAEASRAKLITAKKTGESFAIPGSPLAELVASNLASGKHWCAHFRDLVSRKEDFKNLQYVHGGLVKMRKSIPNDTNEIDNLVIETFHEAWRRRMKGLFSDARESNTDGNRRVDVERERVRNDILRSKTQQQLANWFFDFAARASEGRSLETLRNRDRAQKLRSFYFERKNFERFQNLCLFALLSYASEGADGSKSNLTTGEN